MRKKWLWELLVGPHRVEATEYEGETTSPPDYPIARTTWKHAIRLKEHFGTDQALKLIDERAWKAFRRGDDETSRRWRDLIIAIHAMTEDELRPGESKQ